jgi:hypothetical protein
MSDCLTVGGKLYHPVKPVKFAYNYNRCRLAFKTNDLFAYFQQLKKDNKLPVFEDLEAMARQLYRVYTSSRAQYRAIHDVEGQNEWSKAIPLGSAWTALAAEKSSADIGISTVTGRKGKGAGKPKKQSATQKAASGTSNNASPDSSDASKEAFKGDRVLAKSISFMRDALISRECAYAVAEGDTGRVYECLKASSLPHISCIY